MLWYHKNYLQNEAIRSSQKTIHSNDLFYVPHQKIAALNFTVKLMEALFHKKLKATQ
jgi:hypothetical protein